MDIFITAEIGINHNGNIDIAKQLIDVAKLAGADAVKFQKRSIDVVYTPEYLMSYRESPWGKTQRDQKEGLELLDVDPELRQISPVRYRAILKTTEPQKIINSLQSVGVKSIIPTDEYIISENQSLFPNSFQFTRATVSLPIYPSLTNSEIDIILSVLVKK